MKKTTLIALASLSLLTLPLKSAVQNIVIKNETKGTIKINVSKNQPQTTEQKEFSTTNISPGITQSISIPILPSNTTQGIQAMITLYLFLYSHKLNKSYLKTEPAFTFYKSVNILSTRVGQNQKSSYVIEQDFPQKIIIKSPTTITIEY